MTKKHSEIESLSANDRLTQDSMTRARIHRNTSQSAFYAVVAKYSIDEQKIILRFLNDLTQEYDEEIMKEE